MMALFVWGSSVSCLEGAWLNSCLALVSETDSSKPDLSLLMDRDRVWTKYSPTDPGTDQISVACRVKPPLYSYTCYCVRMKCRNFIASLQLPKQLTVCVWVCVYMWRHVGNACCGGDLISLLVLEGYPLLTPSVTMWAVSGGDHLRGALYRWWRNADKAVCTPVCVEGRGIWGYSSWSLCFCT